jgi:transposase, IS5 family
MGKKRKTRREIGGLFVHLDRRERAAEVTTPLDTLNDRIDFEIFRSLLEELVPRKDTSKGGRPPFDHVFMLKILILQSYYGLSDEKTEFEILDRRSFQRFLGIEDEGRIPDRTTIWNFKEELGEDGANRLFDLFHQKLDEAGLIGRKGRIVDASFVDAPRQRNSRDENKKIKETGEPIEEWTDAKTAQKDVDARWTKKNDETHFGYKNHVSIDEESKLIDRFDTTSANVHDSNRFTEFLEDCAIDRVHADSAYKSAEHDQWLDEQGIKNRVHEKGRRNHPLNGNQKRSNTAKSRIRARVEHIFGFMSQVMGADHVRSIGRARAGRFNALSNLTYNMARTCQLGASV